MQGQTFKALPLIVKLTLAEITNWKIETDPAKLFNRERTFTERNTLPPVFPEMFRTAVWRKIQDGCF